MAHMDTWSTETIENYRHMSVRLSSTLTTTSNRFVISLSFIQTKEVLLNSCQITCILQTAQFFCRWAASPDHWGRFQRQAFNILRRSHRNIRPKRRETFLEAVCRQVHRYFHERQTWVIELLAWMHESTCRREVENFQRYIFYILWCFQMINFFYRNKSWFAVSKKVVCSV